MKQYTIALYCRLSVEDKKKQDKSMKDKEILENKVQEKEVQEKDIREIEIQGKELTDKEIQETKIQENKIQENKIEENKILEKKLEEKNEEEKKIEHNIEISSSIRNQFFLIKRYVEGVPEFNTARILEFYDDGYTGRNFERPMFHKMIQLAHEKKINCIIVKDFSRFGRNYIELGRYLEQIFPTLGIRFISINDYYDSEKTLNLSGNVTIFLKNLINDYYSKDLSKKIISSLVLKKRQGKYLGSSSLFGYKKDKKIQNLVIDEETAPTVREIFSLADKGLGTIEIAKKLNKKGLHTPSFYKRKDKENTINKATNENNIWNRHNVARILREERYTGNYITYIKNEKIVIENHYKKIITREQFLKSQEVLNKYVNKTYRKDETNILSGKVKCGYCSYALDRIVDKSGNYYKCKTNEYSKKNCPFHNHIEEDIILSLLYKVLYIIFSQQKTAYNMKLKQYPFIGNEKDNKKKEQSNISLYDQEWLKDKKYDMNVLNEKKIALYDRYKKEQIVKEEYIMKKEESNCLTNEKVSSYRINSSGYKQSEDYQKMNIKSNIELGDLVDLNYNDLGVPLTRDFIDRMIQSIHVYDETRCEIFFDFSEWL